MVFYFKSNGNSLGEGKHDNSEKVMMWLPFQKIGYETIQWPPFFSVILTLSIFLHVQSYLSFTPRLWSVKSACRVSQIYKIYSPTFHEKNGWDTPLAHWCVNIF